MVHKSIKGGYTPILVIVAVGILLYGGVSFAGKQTDEDVVGTAPRIFQSSQVGSSPQADYILSTNGTVSTWIANSGGAGGSSLHVDGGGYVYPQTGDYHSAPYYVATSSASTFAGFVSNASSTFVGSLGLNVDDIQFNLTPTHTPSEGSIWWNADDKTLNIDTETDTVIQVGQEIVLRVTNKTGVTITDGSIVYINGAQGSRPTITLADSDSEATSDKTVGIVTSEIVNNATGYVTTFGLVRDLNTTGSLEGETWTDGDILYASSTAGRITNVEPVSPSHLVKVGYVVFSDATNGILLADIDLGYELEEVHDVLITSIADNDIIAWDSGTSLYTNQTQAELGIAPFAWTPDALGVATSTLLTFGSGYVSQASSTVVGDFTASTLYGVGSNLTLARIGDSTYSTVQHLQDIFHSTGYADGGKFTDIGGGAISVATGNGFIREVSSATSTLDYFDWTASSSISIPNDTTRYIGVAYNGGTPIVESHTSYDWNLQTDFPLGNIVNEGGVLHLEFAPHRVGDHAGLMIERLYETMSKERDDLTGGLLLGETGTRNVTLTTGVLWDRLNKFTISAIDTSGADNFDTYCGTTKIGTASTTWDNANYCNSGTLTALTANRYAVLWFYIELDGGLIMQYGTNQYTSLAGAEGESAPSTVSPRVSVQSKLLGRFVIQQGGSTANSIESVFETSFAGAVVTDHGSLSGLTDDDHTQYVLVDGTRDVTGVLNFNSGLVAQASSTIMGDTTIGTIPNAKLLTVGDGICSITAGAEGIAGCFAGGGGIYIENTGTGDEVFLEAIGGEVNFGSFQSVDFNFKTGNSERFELKADGTLNIGNVAGTGDLNVWNESSASYFTATGTVGVATSSILHALKINTTETNDNLIEIDCDRQYSSSNSTGGCINIENTNNLRAGLKIYTNIGATANEALLVLESDNTSADAGQLRINSDSASGGDYEIRMDSPNPDIEFIETDQSSPAGKFEIAVQSDYLQINGRNAGDSAFESMLYFERIADGGRVGFGDGSPDAMLEIVEQGTNPYLYFSSTAVANGDILSVTNDGLLTVPDFTTTNGTTTNATSTIMHIASSLEIDSAGALIIPQGTNPTVDAVGEIALDTTDNQLLVADSGGTARVVRLEQKLFSFTLASTSVDFVSGGVIAIPADKDGYDISQFRCYVDGGTSVVVNVSDGTNDTETITCATTITSDTSVDTNSVATAGELMEIQIGTVTGTPDYLSFTAYGHYTRE